VNIERQTLALLEIAEDYRAERCQGLRAKAREDSRRVLGEAHAAARRDLRAMLSPERERLAAEIAAAEARLVTQRRMRDQRRVAAVLEQVWPALARALRERWEAPAGRASWIAHHLGIARRALPARAWVIQHPQDWPPAGREQANQWLRSHAIEDVRFEPDSKLQAGIRVVCGANVLDASLEGLLADRAQIEGRLLHYLAPEQ
jgi:hypothetical protein